MVKAFAFICLALVGQALSAPTPTIPEKYLGTYESRPELDQNFAEFASVFHLPPSVSWTRPNVFYLRKDGDQYVAKLVFGPLIPPFKLRFRLGETQTVVINGQNVEYVYTIENTDAAPLLKGKFRDTATDLKFTIEAAFTPNGINATYAREGVTARRTYDRIVCPSIAGVYENVPEKQSPNFLEFAQRVIPAPAGLTWDSETAVWFGRWGKDFVVKYLVTPTVSVAFPFRWNEKRNITLNGKQVTYSYTLVEENWATRTITIRGEFTSETGTLTVTAVITPEGISATYKAGDQTASRYYRRALNYLVYGTYENVPEASVNWPEFVAATGKDDDSTQKTQVQFYRQGQTSYFRVHYESGKEYVHPFSLNQTASGTNPKGPYNYTYNTKTSYSNDVILGAVYNMGGKTFEVDTVFNGTGVHAIYRSAGIVAQRYYRRVVPAVALGKYESTPDTPEFAAFAQTIGQPTLTKKTTVELTQNPEGNYVQTINVEGAPAPAAFPFTLGATQNATVNGKNLQYTYYYFSYPVPVLTTYWTEANKGPTHFSVAAEFNPTGYTAYYKAQGKLATRTYTRVGAPVPLETYPTPTPAPTA
jgi:hypothetical protein